MAKDTAGADSDHMLYLFKCSRFHQRRFVRSPRDCFKFNAFKARNRTKNCLIRELQRYFANRLLLLEYSLFADTEQMQSAIFTGDSCRYSTDALEFEKALRVASTLMTVQKVFVN